MGSQGKGKDVRRRLLSAVAAIAFLSGCALMPAVSPPPPPAPAEPEPESAPAIHVDVYRRAEMQRAQQLEAEVERLQADLEQAEGALVAAESGLRGNHSRADAVSSVAEVRIRVERAARDAPWRTEQIREARAKLADADQQIQEGHFSAALFFSDRARRISDLLIREGRELPRGARFVMAGRVNLRAAPTMESHVLRVLSRGTPVVPETRDGAWVLVRTTTGSVGWIHRGLIAERSEAVPASPAP